MIPGITNNTRPTPIKKVEIKDRIKILIMNFQAIA